MTCLISFAVTISAAKSVATAAPFVIDLGFTRGEYAAIIKGVGLAALLIGGFAGGFLARACSLPVSLWIGGALQAIANLAFSWQAIVGLDARWHTFAIVGSLTVAATLTSLRARSRSAMNSVASASAVSTAFSVANSFVATRRATSIFSTVRSPKTPRNDLP